jgi:hypothetical protein
MTGWARRIALAVALALAAPGPSGRAAADPPCEFENAGRIVAVGDVQGAHERLLEILRAAGVVDGRGRWAGGRAHLVQLGDVVDRGPDSRKALDLLRQLERDAPRAGGRVHALLGNHEAMRMLSVFTYTVPGEYAAFATSSSGGVRQELVEAAPPNLRERLLAETPLGMIEMVRAFGPAGAYGSFLRRLNAVERIDGVVFAHGGVSPAVATLGCAEINARVRRELTGDVDQTRRAPEGTLAMSEAGPLWYRGLAEGGEATAAQVEEVLAAQRASALVVGHTVRADGRIDVRMGGKVFIIDTGMQPAYAPQGRASALEIQNGVFTAIYTDRREVLR